MLCQNHDFYETFKIDLMKNSIKTFYNNYSH